MEVFLEECRSIRHTGGVRGKALGGCWQGGAGGRGAAQPPRCWGGWEQCSAKYWLATLENHCEEATGAFTMIIAQRFEPKLHRCRTGKTFQIVSYSIGGR